MKAKNLTRTIIWHNYELVKPDPGEYLVTVKSLRGENIIDLRHYSKMYGGWDIYRDEDVVAWAELPAPLAKPRKRKALREKE